MKIEMRFERNLAFFNLFLCLWALLTKDGELLFCTFLIISSLFSVADRILVKLNKLLGEGK